MSDYKNDVDVYGMYWWKH